MFRERYLSLYDAAIAHSDRASVRAVLDRLTLAAFTTTVRGLMERDRTLYQLLLALEVCDNALCWCVLCCMPCQYCAGGVCAVIFVVNK